MCIRDRLQGGVIVLEVVHQTQAQRLGTVEAGGGQRQTARLSQALSLIHI